MELQEDGELLSRYMNSEDQDAFRTLTERYGSLVFGVCRRRIGRSDLAEDATQIVFLMLARKARHLASRRTIAPWLYAASVNISRSVSRAEARRQRYEREALEVRNEDGEPAVDVEQALSKLRGQDRDAIILRYLHGNSLAEVAAALGVTEDAARMRVNRAMAKLKRDLGSGTAALEALAIPVSQLPIRIIGAPSQLLKVLPHRYARLVGGHSFMTSIPALSLAAFLLIGGGTAASLKLHTAKPDPNKPSVISGPISSLLQESKAPPSKDYLKDMLLDILGTWNETLGTEDGGKSTKMEFPGAVVRAGKSKGDVVVHADRPSASIGSMDAKWTIDADKGIINFLTDGPSPDDNTPLHLISTNLNSKKAKVAVFEGKSPRGSYKLTVTFTYNRFEFVVTGQKADGSKLSPEQVSITLARQPKS